MHNTLRSSVVIESSRLNALQPAVAEDVAGYAAATGLHQFLGDNAMTGGGQLAGIKAGGDGFADVGINAGDK